MTRGGWGVLASSEAGFPRVLVTAAADTTATMVSAGDYKRLNLVLENRIGRMVQFSKGITGSAENRSALQMRADTNHRVQLHSNSIHGVGNTHIVTSLLDFQSALIVYQNKLVYYNYRKLSRTCYGSIALHHPMVCYGHMPYTMNPNLPRLRMQAAKLVLKDKWSTREVARHTGFDHSTIVRWVAKARFSNELNIPTKSSRPKHHPNALDFQIVKSILEHRSKYRRCAEVIYHQLNKDGIAVSLSSVKRTLKRNGLTYPSKWKKWHKYLERPLPVKPGVLVEIDSMREGLPQEHLYLYVLIDVFSRYGFAKPVKMVNSWQSAKFFQEAMAKSLFPFQMIQSDHGSEFAKWFKKQVVSSGVTHRHSRVRRPTDNGHVERFIRTIQQECLARTGRSWKAWERAIPDFINYYNTERPHMGISMKTPLEVVQSY